MNLTEIKPGKGIGDLIFGMNREQVKKLLGEPDDIDFFSDGIDPETDRTEAWDYDDHGLSLGFDENEEWKLITIASTSEDCSFNNEKLVNLNREKLIDRLHEMGLENMQIEDWSEDDLEDHEMIRIDEISMNIWLEASEVTAIQISPIIEEDDTIYWPEVSG